MLFNNICASLWTQAVSEFQFCVAVALSHSEPIENQCPMFKAMSMDKPHALCVRAASLPSSAYLRVGVPGAVVSSGKSVISVCG